MRGVYQGPPSNYLPPSSRFAAGTNNRRPQVAPTGLPGSNPLVENLPEQQTSHLHGSLSFQESAELASRRFIDGGSSATTFPRQQPTAQETQSRARMGAFYDPVRDIVLSPPGFSPVAAEPVLGNALSDDGSIETVVATESSPTFSKPNFHQIVGSNTQYSVPNARVEIDRTTALKIMLSNFRRTSASGFHQIPATAVEPDQYQNHSPVKGPLAQTPPQSAPQFAQPNAPRTSPIPQRNTRPKVPAMFRDDILQDLLLRQSNPEEHEQVREAASYGFTTTLQPVRKRSSDAALYSPQEGQEEPPRKKLNKRGGARPGAGRPATKMLRQLASETTQQSLRPGSLWGRTNSAISPGGGNPGHAVCVSDAGSLSSSYSGFPLVPSADPHIQSSSSFSAPFGPSGSTLEPECASVAGAVYTTGSNTGFTSVSSAGTRNHPSSSLSATVGPSDLSGTLPSKDKKRKADGSDIHSVDGIFSAPVSTSVAVSVAASALEILKGQKEKPPRLQLAALDIERVGDVEGGKGDDVSGDVTAGEERRERVVEHKFAKCPETLEKENTPWLQSRNLHEGKSKTEETRGAKEPERRTQEEGDEMRQAAVKGTENGNGKRKASAISPLVERAAEEPAKGEPPAKRAKTATMSSPAVSEAPVRRSARLQNSAAKNCQSQ
ncbi:hypothetical protein NEUTE1DRAFT_55059 [Neurospora tetrasperma FGSC 2508]|uniref:Uncharacterized protein n=1 Tax=Neurospora tetrasperma (strain FGSC 2508 / ATCC MYA-4615 / P0657) TaxID=510951 RepID=F8MZQ7_NEUT8|nr:uncharacterized protein NEUTE1DRAFT_55059 [Neurospora tetrasperma FGSC 2508]EGO52044.1 hypothetical protein NEUTE1DRAFT_55059 [Neurospora tetrasperma FGSC 2508]